MDTRQTTFDLSQTHSLCKNSVRPLELSPSSGYEPKYLPEIWNMKPIIKSTNCYSYALDLREGFDESMRLEPGMICGEIHDERTPEGLLELLKKDLNIMNRKVIQVGFEDKCPDNMYKIAAFFAPDKQNRFRGYHFYRQNPDSTWSHKLGSNSVINTDSDGKLIYNPLDSKKDFFTNELSIFLGYFAVDINSVDPKMKQFIREQYLIHRETYFRKFFPSYDESRR